MDSAFIRAFRPRVHTVCGMRLKPFSLSLLLELEATNSPFRVMWGEIVEDLDGPLLAQRIWRSVAACADRRPRFRFLDGIRSHSFEAEPVTIAFAAYIEDHLVYPEVWQDAEASGQVNAPWLLAKATFLLMQTSLTKEDVWTMPIGQALWYAAAASEQLGGAQLLSEEERKIVDAIERDRR
tara:strand:+ start:33065 stop:33607 length:543 start_codon:yes stop_codon:yes gene_type:complete